MAKTLLLSSSKQERNLRSLQQIHSQRILSRNYCSAHTLGGCLGAGEQRCAIGTLLACGRVHHHLVRTQMRSRVGLLLESAEAREVTLLSGSAILSAVCMSASWRFKQPAMWAVTSWSCGNLRK